MIASQLNTSHHTTVTSDQSSEKSLAAPVMSQSASSVADVVPSTSRSFAASWASQTFANESPLHGDAFDLPPSAPASPLCTEFDNMFATPQSFDLTYRLRNEINPLIEAKALGKFHVYPHKRMSIATDSLAFSPVKKKLRDAPLQVQEDVGRGAAAFMATSHCEPLSQCNDVQTSVRLDIIRKLSAIQLKGPRLCWGYRRSEIAPAQYYALVFYDSVLSIFVCVSRELQERSHTLSLQ